MKDTIRVEHFYSHPPSAVWKALTDPELHARWWAPGDVRAVVGHKFELDMGKWGKQPCEVLEVENERLLKYRFAAGTLDTIITWELVPEGSGTRLKLTHEGFNLDSPLGKQALEGMREGWPQVLARMESVLSKGKRPDLKGRHFDTTRTEMSPLVVSDVLERSLKGPAGENAGTSAIALGSGEWGTAYARLLRSGCRAPRSA